MQRRYRSMQNVVSAIEMLGLLNRRNIGRLFYHADQSLITGGAAAIHTWIDIGDVVAHRAETEAGLNVADSGGQRLRVVVACAEDVEGKTLRAFAADSRQLLQFVDEPSHRLCKARHNEIGNFVICN